MKRLFIRGKKMKILASSNHVLLMCVDDKVSSEDKDLLSKECDVIDKKNGTVKKGIKIGSWLNHVPYWTVPTKEEELSKDEINDILKNYKNI